MREYTKVSPTFWIGYTGRQIRHFGGDTQLLALYLLTSPHSNSVGLYYCPLDTIANALNFTIRIVSREYPESSRIDSAE